VRIGPHPKYKYGDTRTVRRFLWWPVVVNDELRWLEWAILKQKYLEVDTLLTLLFSWETIEFIELCSRESAEFYEGFDITSGKRQCQDGT